MSLLRVFLQQILMYAGLLLALTAYPSMAKDFVEYTGSHGPGKGKHIVFVSGDEEYRSEEGLPQLAKILALHHGFRCTVLFAIDPTTGEIDPTYNKNIPGLDALATANLLVILTRFRDLPDAQMQHIAEYVDSGKPILGMRTATHAFRPSKKSKYSEYSWDSKKWPGGFGKQVLGETWINHHGDHGKQSTRGILVSDKDNHPILRGILSGEIWGPTDVYGIQLPLADDCEPLVLGEVVAGMDITDPPVEGNRNDPMMPIAWTKITKVANGSTRRVFTTTMGAATDLSNQALRRLLVNAAYWCLQMENQISSDAKIDLIGEYEPTPFGFGKFKRGVKPDNLAMPPLRP